MLPRIIQVVMKIVLAAVMSHPLIVRGVNVRRFRMSGFVCRHSVLRGSGLLTSRRFGSPRRGLRPHGSGAVGGKVSTANRWTPALVLRKANCQEQNLQPYYFLHAKSLGRYLAVGI